MSRRTLGHLRGRFGSGRREEPRLARVCGATGGIPTTAAIVVGHDRQLESVAALDTAMEFANRLDAELHIVHVRNLSDYPVDPDRTDWESYASERLEDERVMIIESMAGHPRPWSYYVGRGDPARRLIQLAEQHDALMIIVGSRGEGIRAALGRIIEPAVSHRLIEEAHCPVLVIGRRDQDSFRRRQLRAVRND